MKLEVGMYARYNGKIGKITHICKCEHCEARGYYEPIIEYIHGEEEYVSCYFKNNLKASYNIIDLIEVGDYVNGFQVVDKKDNRICVIKLIIPSDLKEEDIKSIVTKEQFSSMEYKVGE